MPKKMQRKKVKTGGKAAPFRFVGSFFDSEHKNEPIYAIKFNPFVLDRNIFAVCVVNRVLVMECTEADGEMNYDLGDDDFSKIKQIKAYEGEDDHFYSLAWSYDSKKAPVIAAGGRNGIVRTIFMNDDTLGHLISHSKFCRRSHHSSFHFFFFLSSAGAINDMKFHPKFPFLLLTASEDQSVRLWNVETSVCIVVFAGSLHCSQVLSIDFDAGGDHIISTGMDHNLLVWKLASEEIKAVIDKSSRHLPRNPFPTIRVYEHEFLTRSVHDNYVDSVIWFSPNSFLSKSANGDIVWWKTGEPSEVQLNLKTDVITKIHDFKEESPEDERIWFVRMQLDSQRKMLGLGNVYGKILLWNLTTDLNDGIETLVVSHPKSTKPIPMISFSNDGSILLACSLDGKIIRFDKTEER